MPETATCSNSITRRSAPASSELLVTPVFPSRTPTKTPASLWIGTNCKALICEQTEPTSTSMVECVSHSFKQMQLSRGRARKKAGAGLAVTCMRRLLLHPALQDRLYDSAAFVLHVFVLCGPELCGLQAHVLQNVVFPRGAPDYVRGDHVASEVTFEPPNVQKPLSNVRGDLGVTPLFFLCQYRASPGEVFQGENIAIPFSRHLFVWELVHDYVLSCHVCCRATWTHCAVRVFAPALNVEAILEMPARAAIHYP